MKGLTVYDTNTGEIKRTLIVPLHYVVKPEEREGVLDGHYDDEKFMVVDRSPVQRPVVSISDSHSEPQPITANAARNNRNALLGQSDWTQVADAPVDQAAWATYRQALRDVTAQASFPENIDWPIAP